MSFDTDCINYSQGLINESKSSIIRLTYLMCKSVKIYMLLLPNFQRSFSLFIATLLIGSANVEAFLFLPNFIILISKFLENKKT